MMLALRQQGDDGAADEVAMCKRCSMNHLDTPAHRYYELEDNASIEDEALAKTQ